MWHQVAELVLKFRLYVHKTDHAILLQEIEQACRKTKYERKHITVNVYGYTKSNRVTKVYIRHNIYAFANALSQAVSRKLQMPSSILRAYNCVHRPEKWLFMSIDCNKCALVGEYIDNCATTKSNVPQTKFQSYMLQLQYAGDWTYVWSHIDLNTTYLDALVGMYAFANYLTKDIGATFALYYEFVTFCITGMCNEKRRSICNTVAEFATILVSGNINRLRYCNDVPECVRTFASSARNIHQLLLACPRGDTRNYSVTYTIGGSGVNNDDYPNQGIIVSQVVTCMLRDPIELRLDTANVLDVLHTFEQFGAIPGIHVVVVHSPGADSVLVLCERELVTIIVTHYTLVNTRTRPGSGFAWTIGEHIEQSGPNTPDALYALSRILNIRNIGIYDYRSCYERVAQNIRRLVDVIGTRTSDIITAVQHESVWHILHTILCVKSYSTSIIVDDDMCVNASGPFSHLIHECVTYYCDHVDQMVGAQPGETILHRICYADSRTHVFLPHDSSTVVHWNVLESLFCADVPLEELARVRACPTMVHRTKSWRVPEFDCSHIIVTGDGRENSSDELQYASLVTQFVTALFVIPQSQEYDERTIQFPVRQLLPTDTFILHESPICGTRTPSVPCTFAFPHPLFDSIDYMIEAIYTNWGWFSLRVMHAS